MVAIIAAKLLVLPVTRFRLELLIPCTNIVSDIGKIAPCTEFFITIALLLKRRYITLFSRKRCTEKNRWIRSFSLPEIAILFLLQSLQDVRELTLYWTPWEHP